MKYIFLLAIAFTASPAFSQSVTEAGSLNLSHQIFNWEIENKIDSLKDFMSEKCSVVTSRGDIQNKEQYIATLRSGNFKHDSITVEQNIVTIVNNTATVIGKGMFHMTVSGNKLHRHLSFMEVFAKEDKGWKLLAIYASSLPD